MIKTCDFGRPIYMKKKYSKETRYWTECQLFAVINNIFLFSIITNQNKHIKYQIKFIAQVIRFHTISNSSSVLQKNNNFKTIIIQAILAANIPFVIFS